MVLLLLFVLPFLQSSQYFDPASSMEMGFLLCVQIYNTGTWDEYRVAMANYVDKNSGHNFPLVYMQIPNYTISEYGSSANQTIQWQSETQDIADFRTDEISTSIIIAENGVEFISVWSVLEESNVQSILSIFRTVFVCLVLSIASYFFTNDANVLVLLPLERMLEKVKLIAKNPLAASSDEVEDAGIFSMMHQKEL